MKACTFDRSCGGKSYDAKLAKYFAEDFKEKFIYPEMIEGEVKVTSSDVSYE